MHRPASDVAFHQSLRLLLLFLLLLLLLLLLLYRSAYRSGIICFYCPSRDPLSTNDSSAFWYNNLCKLYTTICLHSAESLGTVWCFLDTKPALCTGIRQLAALNCSREDAQRRRRRRTEQQQLAADCWASRHRCTGLCRCSSKYCVPVSWYSRRNSSHSYDSRPLWAWRYPSQFSDQKQHDYC